MNRHKPALSLMAMVLPVLALLRRRTARAEVSIDAVTLEETWNARAVRRTRTTSTGAASGSR
jgi:hypothetical protein